MSLPVNLINSETFNEPTIDRFGGVLTHERITPPHSDDVPSREVVFRQFFTSDGTSSGSNDMQVDGSSTNVDFYIPSHATRDRWIKTLSFVIADTAGGLNEFSDTGSALSNGVQLIYNFGSGEEVFIHDALKTNFDFERLALSRIQANGGNNPFRVSNAVSAAEAYIPVVDLQETFGTERGVRIDAGSAQQVIIRIRDDLTVAGITQFDCIGYGTEIIPD